MKTSDCKRASTLILFIILFLTTINGRSKALPDNIEKANNQITLGQRITGMATLMRDNYPEKIYIQTDRPIYNLYDTIWYKVWVMQAGTLFPTEKSQLVYVDLINEVNRVTQSAQYTLKGGSANGQFVLTKAIQDKGLYRIRAYTRWQKNFGDSACFEKIIPIWGDKDKEQENKRFVSITNAANRELFITQGQFQKRKQKAEEEKLIQAQKKANGELELDVQFLPEGGKLIAGVPNRVAYKALFPDGRSVAVEGTIVDQHGNDIVSFTSEHKGMGSFLLLPDTGKQYAARLFNDQLIPLPAVEKEGVTLMVVSKPTSDTLVVAVNGSPGVIANQTQFTLLAESRGLPTKEAYNIRMNKSRVLLRIPKENLKSGINRLTLFTADGQPLSERLVYIDRKDELTFDVKANWEIKSDTDQMMTLKIRPQLSGQSVAGSFAVSVTNKNRVPVDSIQKTFRSEMLLSSDLKGFIETPGYYFNNPYDSICKQLDLLLLTHGWRGYNWDDVTRKSFTHLPDTAFSVSGTVVNLLLKPIEGRRISLFVQGGKTIAKNTKTDKNGRFAFENLDIRETSFARINIEKTKSKRNLGLGIKLDSIYEKPKFPIVPLEDYLYESEEIDSLMFGYEEKKEEDNAYLDSLRKQKGIHLLKEVTVTERKIIKNSYNRSGSGVADIVIDSVQIGRYDAYANVIDILKAEIPGFKKDNSSPLEEGGVSEFKAYDNYNINGRPVFFQIDAEIINMVKSTTSASNDAAVAPVVEWMNNVHKRLSFGSSSPLNSRTEAVASYVNDERSIIGTMNVEDFEYGKLTRLENILKTIPGKEVRGIEVLTTRENLSNYNDQKESYSLDNDGRPIASVIIITTKSGRGARDRTGQSTYYTELLGGSIPKKFYVPRYYPKDPIDQINYDGKHVYYWNPSLLTNGEREVEVSFPVGAYMKGNLQLEIEGTDLNGHIGTQRQEINLNR
ncbi:MAG: hypothetical protein PHI48_00135 [Bacteroidales bacterium]|nr:hypothetical protein [Bacteroidales bacterium]MDD4820955.1 hypothetical protein [Bacteroidales bacterium]